MKFCDRISWSVCVGMLAVHVTSATAEVYLDDAGIETSAPTTIEIEKNPKSKVDTSAQQKDNDPVAFYERTDQIISGASSNQEVFFSAITVNGNIKVSFKLHGKEFLFTYGSISLQKKDLHNIQLILNGSKINKKTQEDDVVLSTLINKLTNDLNQLNPLENGILSSLDFLINMVPRDEPLDKIDLQGAKQSSLIGTQAITNFCADRGKSRSVSFNGNDGATYRSGSLVGDPASGCRGRCGAGCFQTSQIRKRQYTKECLAHDQCAAFFNENLGNCKNEFDAATDGYFNAPNCSFYVIGQWKMTYDWGCNNTVGTVRLTLYGDNKFVSSSGAYGTWRLSAGDVFLLNYSNGTVYTTRIEASNLAARGTMRESDGSSGCATQKYVTTRIN